MTTIDQVVLAAIPGADAELIGHIVWGRTPFPVGKISAQSLYKAASAFARAKNNNRRLCDFCHNQIVEDKWVCPKCDAALHQHLTETD